MSGAGARDPDRSWRGRLWRAVGRAVFRGTPYGAVRLRRAILRAFGATLGSTCRVRRSADIDCPWNLRAGEWVVIGDGAVLRARAGIELGDRCTISQLAILTTEIREGTRAPGGPALGPIVMEADSWVATDALVLPGVRIGEGAVVGARSTVAADIGPWRVAVGDPARERATRIIRPPAETESPPE